MGTRKKTFLILDANILIDLYKCDWTLVKLISTHVGKIHLATPVLSEVNEIDEDDCVKFGIVLVEPELEHVISASQAKGPLSFQDNLCLILAKEYGWTCVSNDKPLRKKCQDEEVPVIWGIELICILVEAGGLPVEQAKDVIKGIQESNPKYITDNIVKKALRRLGLDNCRVKDIQ
ncbi:MAG: hypothetical protein PWQ96_1590 [Clostridia bacterium]|jgi:rRNA-processing protein FCF1|nr:hypothetical protein [Clostridiales bacterium]MDK2985947.1 hypothetical protein [Clostridia bacterium]